MRKYNASYILVLIVLFISNSCATYTAQYRFSEKNWEAVNDESSENKISHTFYLIGDAGNAALHSSLSHLQLLKKELESKDENSTVLFLGDNIYEKGMPKKEHPFRELAEHRIDAQIEIVENFKGDVIFIPGNHDYYSEGIKGLKRQEKYVREKIHKKNSFLPRNGCPIESVNINTKTVLIVIDTQWYLEDWNKNPGINDDCEIKTRELFFDEYERLLKKNEGKTIVVALHHPLVSNGSHGCEFTLKKQLFPFHKKIPLPVVGSLISLLRKTTGISPQDIMNPIYRELNDRLTTISKGAENVILVSGHDHNLQQLEKEEIPQIISGSGSKKSAVRRRENSDFAYGNLGYAKLVVYANGKSEVFFFSEENNQQQLLFRTELYPEEKAVTKNYNWKYNTTKDTSIYSPKETSKSSLYKALWGNHYRNYYSKNITAPIVNLDTLFGGVTPTRRGGGHQSKSLRLETKNNEQYVMRALRKSATQYLQAVAYKKNTIGNYFDGTKTEALLQDIYTTAHPYTPFIVDDLSKAATIFHTNPTLVYIPKQSVLKNFNNNYGDELYMIEERVTSGHKKESFGNATEIIGTDDLLKKLRKSDNNSVDENEYLKARLFDMLIGDWDRHEDQWRWAEFEEGKKNTYKPIPRDRDQAFSNSDGFILKLVTKIIPALRLMQEYNADIENVKWFNLEPYPLDLYLLKSKNLQDWLVQATYLQTKLTPEKIDDAFSQLPPEVIDETSFKIKETLKLRIKNLPKIAKEYYQILSKYSIVTGTDKDNLFEIERKTNGNTIVKIYNIKDGKKGSKFYERTFLKEETKEIWLYGLDDKDIFKVTGISKNAIKLRLIGGLQNDSFIINNHKRVTVYDYKSKKNSFEGIKPHKIKLTDDYETNVFNHKKASYNQNQIYPIIGSNPDDGIKIGLKNIYTVNSFTRNPFTQQHTFNAAYYSANNGYDLNYNAEFANVINQWNFNLAMRFTSPNYSVNYFGMGNKSINYEDIEGADYHRVRMSTISFSPSLQKRGRMGSILSYGLFAESIEIEATENRFISTQNIELDNRKYYAGFHSHYEYENLDNKFFPTLGMKFILDLGWRLNVQNENENNGYIKPMISFTHRINQTGTLVFSTRLKSNFIIGNNFEFYNAASIGGYDGLRGYRNHRFVGNSSFFQNSDLRYSFKRKKTSLFPIQYGVFGGFDYGRVWLQNESSKNWKTSTGGGLWLSGAEMLNFNVGLFSSKEGPYFRLGLGFNM